MGLFTNHFTYLIIKIKKSKKIMLRSFSHQSLFRSKHSLAVLPDLPYDFNALEPYISAEIMVLHHSKHHQAYVTNFNLAQSQLIDAIEQNDYRAQATVQSALAFNRGGHINHR
jgi:Fe-Mn family superoxide dismutase